MIFFWVQQPLIFSKFVISSTRNAAQVLVYPLLSNQTALAHRSSVKVGLGPAKDAFAYHQPRRPSQVEMRTLCPRVQPEAVNLD